MLNYRSNKVGSQVVSAKIYDVYISKFLHCEDLGEAFGFLMGYSW